MVVDSIKILNDTEKTKIRNNGTDEEVDIKHTQQNNKEEHEQKSDDAPFVENRPHLYSKRMNEDITVKQHRFTHQKSILKNSKEINKEDKEFELLEAKKQLILRRRRLFSHYRQYEQWRRRQFSYDPCYYYRANPLPIGQAACSDYINVPNSATTTMRRRHQYRRQYSYADRSREDSRESRETSSLHKYQSTNFIASDTTNTDSTVTSALNNNQTQRTSFDNSECGGLGYLPSQCTSRHIHLLQEEPQSTLLTQRSMRSRINSAIFVSSEGYGFDSIEFLRRHGSQSVLCRRARSAENITSSERNKNFDRKWQNVDKNNISQIELHECGVSDGIKLKNVVPSVQQKADSSVAAVISTTSSNTVIGSILIEMPPPHLKEDLKSQSHCPQYASIASTSSTSHDSTDTDTVEELISVTTDVKTQRSTTSPHKNQNVKKSQRNPMNLHINLKNITKPKTNALPMLSVSGPSPSYENPLPSNILQTHSQPQQPPSECL